LVIFPPSVARKSRSPEEVHIVAGRRRGRGS